MHSKSIKFLAAALIAALPLTLNAAPEDQGGEPEIIIKQMEDKTVHEYRINGFLYAIKIMPKDGKPYYLVAEEGGENYMRVDEPRFVVPKWEILTW